MATSVRSKEKCFIFTWIIENFSFLSPKKDERISSPSFTVEMLENTKWNLWIYPDGYKDDEYISLFLYRREDSKGPSPIDIEYELSFITGNESSLESTCLLKHPFEKGSSWGSTQFQKKQNIFQLEKMKYLPEDVLTVCCKIWKKITSMKQDGQCIARTRIEVERRSFLWAVERFSFFESKMKNVYRIKHTEEDKTIMTLNMFAIPNNNIRLELITSNQNLVFHFHLLILDVIGNTELIAEKEYSFQESLLKKLLFPSRFKKNKLIARKDLYLLNDVLTLRCECTFSTGNVSSGIESISYGCTTPLMQEVVPDDSVVDDKKESGLWNTLGEILKSIHIEQLFCDTKLKTRKRVFPAHRCILGVRSPVFKAMFTNDMKEKRNECVNIEDLDDDTIQRMLLYMYTNELEELQWGSACNLYAAADKYEILPLKEKCSSYLKDNLCSRNACKALILADMHCDEDMKTTVQDFILRHHKDVFNRNEWKQLMDMNSKLAAQIMYLKFKE